MAIYRLVIGAIAGSRSCRIKHIGAKGFSGEEITWQGVPSPSFSNDTDPPCLFKGQGVPDESSVKTHRINQGAGSVAT